MSLTAREHAIKISQVDAACRQINEAVWLFFGERDSVAVHTLAAAAHGIVRDLLQREKKGSLLKDSPVIRKEKLEEWRNALNSYQNFFKHARRPYPTEIEYNPEVAVWLLFDAVTMYREITGETSHEATVFLAWFLAAFHGFLLDGASKNQVLQALPRGFAPADFATLRKLLQRPGLVQEYRS